MMTKTAVQQDTCNSCGVEVREESQFCYNCGKSVVKAVDVDTSVNEPSSVAAEPEAARAPLRSAASLRKQRRAHNRQPVKVAWEPREGASPAFVVATVALTVGAFILLVLALYLR